MAYQSVNPTTGKVLKTFENHTDAEIEAALASAHALYKSPWCKGSRGPRLKVLHRFAELMDERVEDFARILTDEMGKRIKEARTEVRITADIARYYAENAETFLAREKVPTAKGDAWIEYHPIGVVVAVEPWNFPLYQLIRVAGPNLAIGNPVLAKHASMVPQAAVAFERLLLEAGAPMGPGRTSLRPGTRSEGSSLTIGCRASPLPVPRAQAASLLPMPGKISRSPSWNSVAAMCSSSSTMRMSTRPLPRAWKQGCAAAVRCATARSGFSCMKRLPTNS